MSHDPASVAFSPVYNPGDFPLSALWEGPSPEQRRQIDALEQWFKEQKAAAFGAGKDFATREAGAGRYEGRAIDPGAPAERGWTVFRRGGGVEFG